MKFLSLLSHQCTILKRIFNNIFSCKIFYFLIFLSTTVNSAMVLNKSIVYFKADAGTTEDVVVRNPDRETLYLQTDVYKVINPGTDDEQRIKVENPDEIMMLVTPQRAVIPSGRSKTIRLVSLEVPKHKEEVYRITFRPIVGDVKATETAIKILIAYQNLIFVEPENPYYEVVAHRNKNEVTFKNSGNVNVFLRSGKQCRILEGESICEPMLDSFRIYAGETKTITITEDIDYIEYGLFNGETEERVTFIKESS